MKALSPVARTRLRRVAAWMGGSLALFTLVGFFALPPILRKQLEQRLTEALHRAVTVEEVRVNPFSPSLTVRGFKVTERGGQGTFVSFDELYVNLSWRSVVKVAPVVDEVRWVRPVIRISRGMNRAYSVDDLVGGGSKDASAASPAAVPGETEAGPPKFAVFNIQLVDGRFEFDDAVTGEHHEVADLRVGIPFLSSLPADVEVTVAPELSARVNGSQLGLKGETRPFSGARVTTLNLDLDAFDLTRLVDYLPVSLQGQLASAKLDTRLVVSFEQPDGKAPQVKVRGAAAVHGVALRDAEGRDVVGWERLGVELEEVDPFAPSVRVKAVEWNAPALDVALDADGQVNLAALLAQSADKAGTAEEEKTKEGAALRWSVASFALREGRVAFRNGATAPPFEAEVKGLDVTGKNLDGTPGSRSDWTVALQTGAGESLKVTAGVVRGKEGASAEGRLELDALALPRYQQYLQDSVNLVVDEGTLGLGVDYRYQPAEAGSALTLESLSLAVSGFRAHLAGEKAPLVKWESLELKDTRVEKGAAKVVRLGGLVLRKPWLDIRKEKDGRMNLKRISRPDPNPPRAPAVPWRVDVGALRLEDGEVAYEDRSLAEPVRFKFSGMRLGAENLSTERGQRGRMDFRTGVDRAGTFSLVGPVSVEPVAGELRMEARKLNIVPVQRYLDDEVTFALTSGVLAAKGLVQFELPDDRPMKLSYRGDVAVTDFGSVDKEKREDLLKWKSLTVRGVDYVKAPRKVAVDEVVLADFYARTVLSTEGKVNLAELFGPSEEKEEAPKEAAVAAAPQPEAPPAKTRIGKVVMSGGQVRFSDFFIIQRGKLSVKLKYLVQDKKLSAENNFYLDQFTFGEKVESPTATRLPVTLAVALLKDQHGVIDVDLPVSGSLDDPEFSVIGLVFKVLGNLVVKAVSAPFALLGAAFGGGEELAYLEFAPGLAVVDGAGTAKLQTLAKALKGRPGLRLDVGGRVEAETDREGLLRRGLAQRVRAQKFDELLKGPQPPASVDEVTVGAEEYAGYVEKAYREELARRPRPKEKGAGKPPSVGEMEAWILGGLQVTEEELRLLANARAQAAKEWLTGPGGVAAERIFIVAPKLTPEGIKDAGRTSRVEFTLK